MIVHDTDHNNYNTEEEYQSDLEKRMRVRGKKLATHLDNPTMDFEEITATKFGTYLIFLAQQPKHIQKYSFNEHRNDLYHLYRIAYIGCATPARWRLS
jgi:hypothetical protein